MRASTRARSDAPPSPISIIRTAGRKCPWPVFVDFAGRGLGYTIDDVVDEFIVVRKLSAKQKLGANWTVADGGQVDFVGGTGQRKQTRMK